MQLSGAKAPPSWLRGLFAVPPTPMRPGGALDLDSLDPLVDYYLEQGARGLVPVSVVGEGDTLTDAERVAVIERVAARAAGRAPVLAGVLETDTRSAVRHAREAISAGACGLLIKAPRGPVHDQLDHFCAIASSVDVPIVLLDYPQGGSILPVSVIERLAERLPQVCGIKLEEEPTTRKMSELRRVLGERMRIFGASGGAFCLEELEHGADGFFTGCPFAAGLVSVLECFQAGNDMGAVEACEAILPMIAYERRWARFTIGLRKEILRRLHVIRHAHTRSSDALPAEALSGIPAGRHGGGVDALKASVLIVDRSKLSALLLQRLLRAAGHLAVTAPDARAMLHVLAEKRFDIVIADLNSEPTRAVELLQQIRATAPAAPCIVLIGEGCVVEGRGCQDGVADAILHKPYDEDEVRACLRKLTTTRARDASMAGTKRSVQGDVRGRIAASRRKDAVRTGT